MDGKLHPVKRVGPGALKRGPGNRDSVFRVDFDPKLKTHRDTLGGVSVYADIACDMEAISDMAEDDEDDELVLGCALAFAMLYKDNAGVLLK